MLKLRKNKKGFTLVELIVVIAIMAVLAGTVAGVTVTQLNKQTDNTNNTQAKKIADTIYAELMEEPTTGLDAMMTELGNAYGTIVKTEGAKKGEEFTISYTPEAKSGENVTAYAYYTVSYVGKQSGTKGNVEYYISAENGVQKTADAAKQLIA